MRGCRRAVVVPSTKAVCPGCGQSIGMLVVLLGPDLLFSLVPHPTIVTSVLSDPCLGKNGRVETRYDGDVTFTTRGCLRQDDVANLESAIGLVAGPGIRDVGEVALSTLLPKRPGPGRPGEVAGSEGLTPLMVSREVVTARNKGRAIGVGRRIDEPAIPVRPVIEGPAVWLRVTDIRDVGVVPGAGCCVLRYSHFDLFSRWSSRWGQRARE